MIPEGACFQFSLNAHLLSTGLPSLPLPNEKAPFAVGLRRQSFLALAVIPAQHVIPVADCDRLPNGDFTHNVSLKLNKNPSEEEEVIYIYASQDRLIKMSHTLL